MSDKEIVETLNGHIDEAVLKTVWTCALVMLASILMHDADHLRQAFNWGYSIPLALLVLNLVVYLLPAVSIFLVRMRRMSAPLVTCFTGIFTSAGFLVIHLCGAFSGLWGVWNYSYFELIQGVTYNGVFYQGVDVWSWVFLFEVPALCLPCSAMCLAAYLKATRAAKTDGAE